MLMKLEFPTVSLSRILFDRDCILSDMGRDIALPLGLLSSDVQSRYGELSVVPAGIDTAHYLWFQFIEADIRRMMSTNFTESVVFSIYIVDPQDRSISPKRKVAITITPTDAVLYRRAVFMWLLDVYPDFFYSIYNKTYTQRVLCMGPGTYPQRYAVQFRGAPGVMAVNYLCDTPGFNEHSLYAIDKNDVVKLLNRDVEKVLHLRTNLGRSAELYKANIIVSDTLTAMFEWYCINCWRYIVNRNSWTAISGTVSALLGVSAGGRCSSAAI